MVAHIIDFAEYRQRKAEAARWAAQPPVSPIPVMAPVFCGYGWFLMPMMRPASGGAHA